MGGQLAEDGVHRSPEEQLASAKAELNRLLPWLDLSAMEWRSFFVNRAEAAQAGGKRPNVFSLEAIENRLIAWPTKLVLSPLLADQMMSRLQQEGVQPAASIENVELFASLEKPKTALAIWDEYF